jgi:hypothetical protein
MVPSTTAGIVPVEIRSNNIMTTTTPETTIKIPEAINILPMPINEKITLALIDRNPRCRNADLARAIGMSERGVKKLIQRLASGGYLQHVRKGRARRLFLKFHVEQGTRFPGSEISTDSSMRELCSATPAETEVAPTEALVHAQSLEDDFEQTMKTIDELTRQRDFFPETVVRLLQPLIARIEAEMSDGPERQKILLELMSRQGAFMVVALGAGLPKKVQRQLDERISHATAEQLVEFRYRALADGLKDKAPLLLAGWCAENGDK